MSTPPSRARSRGSPLSGVSRAASFALAFSGLVLDARDALGDAHATGAGQSPSTPEETEAARAVFFAADVAFTRSDMGLVADDLSFDRTGANGTMYGVTAGYRTHELRFGLRWRVYDTTEFDLWSFAVSAGYSLSSRPLAPTFSAHLGYVFDQRLERALFRSSLPDGNVLTPDVDVKGVMLGLDAEASYWLTPFLRVGPFAGVDLTLLSRARAPRAQSIYGPVPEFDAMPLYTETGLALGLNGNVGLRGAFDVGLR